MAFPNGPTYTQPQYGNKLLQLFEIRPKFNLGANVYEIHSVMFPNFVVRHTPLIPGHSVLLWKHEENNPLQAWYIDNNVIRPFKSEIPNCCLHLSLDLHQHKIVNDFGPGCSYAVDNILGMNYEKFHFDLELKGQNLMPMPNMPQMVPVPVAVPVPNPVPITPPIYPPVNAVQNMSIASAPPVDIQTVTSEAPNLDDLSNLPPPNLEPNAAAQVALDNMPDSEYDKHYNGTPTPIIQALELDKIAKLEKKLTECEAKLEKYEKNAEKYEKIKEIVESDD